LKTPLHISALAYGTPVLFQQISIHLSIRISLPWPPAAGWHAFHPMATSLGGHLLTHVPSMYLWKWFLEVFSYLTSSNIRWIHLQNRMLTNKVEASQLVHRSDYGGSDLWLLHQENLTATSECICLISLNLIIISLNINFVPFGEKWVFQWLDACC
jgi:hypothetical protein